MGLAFYAYRHMQIPNVPCVPQIWTSTGVEYANTDSVAALRDAEGRVRVLATAKWGDRLDIFDGATGIFIESIGKGGESPGAFRRPNGITIVQFSPQSQRAITTNAPSPGPAEQVVVVVEREGARVQVLAGDDCHPRGMVGERILRRPYGAAVSYREKDPLLYVTDTDVTPDKTVSVFRLSRTAQAVSGELVQQFGDIGQGRIHKAESILVDDDFGRVLLCDEDRSQRNVKVYDLAGAFTGRTFGDGIIDGDPEGIALVHAPAGDFILVTDQRSKITIWHAFDRESLKFLASFSGEPRIANTDGICVFEGAIAGHAAGALIAVNDDADIRAFDLAAIIQLIRGDASAPSAVGQ